MSERDYSNDPYADPYYQPPKASYPGSGPRPATDPYWTTPQPGMGTPESGYGPGGVANPGFDPKNLPGYTPPPPPANGGGVVNEPGRDVRGFTPEDDARDGLFGGYYDERGVWVRGSPRGTGGGGGGGNAGGGGMGGGPDYRMLPFSPYQSAGAFTPRNATFSFDPYKASSWEDAAKEPGYDASRTQLRKQIEAGAAHSGMVRSGMTIGDLYSNLDALGQQNFTNFDNRNFRNWSGNRDLAATKFGLELGVDRDIYDRHAQDVDRGNNYRFNTEDSSFRDALTRWTEMTRSLTSIATAGSN